MLFRSSAAVCSAVLLCVGTADAQVNPFAKTTPTARFGTIEVDASRAPGWGDFIDSKELKKQIAGLKGALLYREGDLGFYRVGFETVGNRADGAVRVTVTIVGQSGNRTILASGQSEQRWRGGLFLYQEPQPDAPQQNPSRGSFGNDNGLNNFGNNSALQTPPPNAGIAYQPANFGAPFARAIAVGYRENKPPSREEKTGHADGKKARDPEPKPEPKRAPDPEPKREPKREERPQPEPKREPKREEKRAPDPRPEPPRAERPRDERPQPQRDDRPSWERKTKPRRDDSFPAPPPTQPPTVQPPVIQAPPTQPPIVQPPVVQAPQFPDPQPKIDSRPPSSRPLDSRPFNSPNYSSPAYNAPPTTRPPAARPLDLDAPRASYPDPNPPGANTYPDPNPPYRGGPRARDYSPRYRPYRSDWGNHYYDYFDTNRNYYNYYNYYYAPTYGYNAPFVSDYQAPFIQSYTWSRRASDEGARQAFEFALISARASAQADFDRQLTGENAPENGR